MPKCEYCGRDIPLSRCIWPFNSCYCSSECCYKAGRERLEEDIADDRSEQVAD